MYDISYVLSNYGLYHPVAKENSIAKLHHIRLLSSKISNEGSICLVYNSYHNTISMCDDTVWKHYNFRPCTDYVRLAFNKAGRLEVQFYAR